MNESTPLFGHFMCDARFSPDFADTKITETVEYVEKRPTDVKGKVEIRDEKKNKRKRR